MGIVQEREALRAEIRIRKKEVLPRLKQAVTRAKKKRTDRLRECGRFCEQQKREAMKRISRSRKRFEEVIAGIEKKAQIACQACKTTANEKGLKSIEDALAALEKETEELRAMRQKAERMKAARGRKGGLKSAEVKAESDSEVIHNLGENQELIALFKKNRQKFKKTKGRSRTEAFFEWLNDHPEELDEFRAKEELKYEKEAEKLWTELTAERACELSLDECQRALDRYRRAEELALQEVPF
jgi:hypothetical protein